MFVISPKILKRRNYLQYFKTSMAMSKLEQRVIVLVRKLHLSTIQTGKEPNSLYNLVSVSAFMAALKASLSVSVKTQNLVKNLNQIIEIHQNKKLNLHPKAS